MYVDVKSNRDQLYWNNLNPFVKYLIQQNIPQLVGWFIFGSFLILKGAFLNYLDDGGLPQLSGGLAQLEGSRVRWGRSVEVDQGIQDQHSHSFWNAEQDHQGIQQDDHSHLFVHQLAVSVINSYT